ncbi:MAG: hypothetical protein RBU21_14330 [FCB group bacterium]|jgi:hypothetical protein|nr:hypothetical protein [FCB group bacterium]
MDHFSRGTGKRAAALALCLLACSAVGAADTAATAEAGNLLANPGFEQYDKGLPVGWSLFVQPHEGASGTLDRNGKAVQGRNAILLSTETPYETDPFNNWSQNVVQDFNGKIIVLKGAIRTDNATQAALWVQCWRKDPWSMLASTGSGTAFPMAGTKDWTRVEVRMKAPRGTDYVTVRCVLSGTGKAWFDDLSMTTEAAPAPVAALSLPSPPPAALPPAQPQAAHPETADTLMPALDANTATLSSLMGLLSGDTEGPDLTPRLKMPLPPVRPVAPPRASPMPKRADVPPAQNNSMQELVNANRMLMESYQALRETNAELAEQVKAQQKEIDSLRRQQRQGRGTSRPAPKAPPPVEAPEPPAAAPEPEPEAEPEAAPEQPAPPLVPSTTENSR